MAPSAEAEPRRRNWHQVLVTVVLAVAAVATAWSSYQATRWNGEQAAAAGRTNAVRIEAARAESLSEGQREVDVATFIAWAGADQTGEQELAEFYESRFRPEFKAAFDAWLDTDPLTNTSAPPTPFVMEEYDVEALEEAERLDVAAEASAGEVREYIQRASNYVLSVVLYAMALFFAGMSNQISRGGPRTALITIAYLALIAAVSWVATFPVSVKV